MYIRFSFLPLRLPDLAFLDTQGSFDTQRVALFKAGLPGLSIPGFITLGPEFSLSSELQLDLNVATQMSVTAAFEYPNVDMVFPPTHAKKPATARLKKTDNRTEQSKLSPKRRC
jgi:hypothetical protein